MFGVKRQLLEALLSDPEWNAKLSSAKTMREVERVLREFVVEKGWKIVEVETGK
jgi:hypothetical protein